MLTKNSAFMAVGLIVMAIAFGPLILIWSLNTLFPVLGIKYTASTWLAAAVLSSTVIKVKNNV